MRKWKPTVTSPNDYNYGQPPPLTSVFSLALIVRELSAMNGRQTIISSLSVCNGIWTRMDCSIQSINVQSDDFNFRDWRLQCPASFSIQRIKCGTEKRTRHQLFTCAICNVSKNLTLTNLLRIDCHIPLRNEISKSFESCENQQPSPCTWAIQLVNRAYAAACKLTKITVYAAKIWCIRWHVYIGLCLPDCCRSRGCRAPVSVWILFEDVDFKK